MNKPLKEIVLLFLKLGIIGFGGPAAHIAMMEDEVVRRRAWISRQDFLDLLGATNLIPGPNSTEMAIHIGHRRAGWPGLVLAGVSFILPAMLIVIALAWTYVRYGSLPRADSILYTIKPVVTAVILQALWRLGRSALKSMPLAAVAASGVLLNLIGINELLVLFAGGIAIACIAWVRNGRNHEGKNFSLSCAPAVFIFHAATASSMSAMPFGLLPLFLFFLKVGSVLFGSGYVLLAFLRADLVSHWHWLSNEQLLDAIAVGQVTPGPVFTTATFIGYVLGGYPGALIATTGIFLPAFVFVALSGPVIPRIRRSVIAGAFLDGVVAASLSLMAVVTYTLGRAAITDYVSVLLLAVSAVLLIRFRINATWLILGAALVGLILR